MSSGHYPASFVEAFNVMWERPDVVLGLENRTTLPAPGTPSTASRLPWQTGSFSWAVRLVGCKYIILKQRNWICDVTPLQEELGFTPEYPLRKGLEESIEWYCKEGWL